jgi:hypothetical protein
MDWPPVTLIVIQHIRSEAGDATFTVGQEKPSPHHIPHCPFLRQSESILILRGPSALKSEPGIGQSSVIYGRS